MNRPPVVLFFLLAALSATYGQQEDLLRRRAEQLLKERGEVCFVFPRPAAEEMRLLSHHLSIDRVDRDSVRAYANASGFRYFLGRHLAYRLCMTPAATKGMLTAASLQQAGLWDVYPTYPQYDSLMQAFARAHPALCRLDTLGTTYQGRLLLAVKISDHVQLDEDEPAFFYTSSMHGDETGGYVLLLHLIDSLLSGYDQGGTVKALVDSLEIWINPLANPDGTYHNGDNSVAGATRYNAQGIDLNRNYPDLIEGPHPDNHDYAVENVAMMQFLQKHRFAMSANFHAGDEVVNYPWDSWNSEERVHADDEWFHHISRQYADTVHAHAPAGYMTGPSSCSDCNGVTNGGDWYKISGGRQDYVTGFLHGREVTIELDNTKITPAEELIPLWNYNKRSLLNYMAEALRGLAGYTVDSLTGDPVAARLEILNHDDEYSWTYSDSVTGYFYRTGIGGMHNLRVTAGGYADKLLTDIPLPRDSLALLTIRMSRPLTKEKLPALSFSLSPNPVPAGGTLYLLLPRQQRCSITLISPAGRKIPLISNRLLHAGKNAVTLPPGLHGLWLITVTGDTSVPQTRKLIIY